MDTPRNRTNGSLWLPVVFALVSLLAHTALFQVWDTILTWSPGAVAVVYGLWAVAGIAYPLLSARFGSGRFWTGFVFTTATVVASQAVGSALYVAASGRVGGPTSDTVGFVTTYLFLAALVAAVSYAVSALVVRSRR